MFHYLSLRLTYKFSHISNIEFICGHFFYLILKFKRLKKIFFINGYSQTLSHHCTCVYQIALFKYPNY